MSDHKIIVYINGTNKVDNNRTKSTWRHALCQNIHIVVNIDRIQAVWALYVIRVTALFAWVKRK